MFRATEALRLDVLRGLLPACQSPAHPATAIRAVGIERGAILLFAVHCTSPEGRGRTFVNAFECRTRGFEQLWETDEELEVVWATTNEHKSVLGLTVLYRASDGRNLYDSVVAFIGPYAAKKPGLVTQRSEHPQRLQWLYDSVWRGEHVAYLLFVSEREKAVVISACGAPNRQSLRIESTAAGKHSFLHLDQRSNTLYALHGAMLRCVRLGPDAARRSSFGSGGGGAGQQRIVEYALACAVVQDELHSASPFPYNVGSGEPRLPQLPCARVVSLEGSSACLCVQHEFPVGPDGEPVPAVPVTVCALRSRTRVDFTIPLLRGAADAGQLLATRVVFDTLADYIVVWIPGHYLHLLDLSELHSASAGVVATGADAAAQRVGQTAVVAFDMLLPSESSDEGDRALQRPPDVVGHAVLDAAKGIVFNYCFDRTHLLKMFEAPRPEMHALLLHAACIHMEDMELAHQVVMHVLSTNPSNAKVGLFKEFLSGATFSALRFRLPPHILSKLSSTTTDTVDLAQALRKRTDIENSSVAPLCSNAPSSLKSSPRDAGRYERRSSFGSSHRQNLLVFFRTLFGSQPSRDPADMPHPFLVADGARGGEPHSSFERARYPEVEAQIATLAAALREHFPSKDDCARAGTYAEACIKCQIEQTEALDHLIALSFAERSSTPRDKLSAFQTMEKLLCAITELQIITPRGFQLRFSQLAFDCLPESVFLQYVDRDVVRVTGELVAEMQKRGIHQSSPGVFYHVLCKLPLRAAVAALVSQGERMPQYVLEHALSAQPQLAMALGRVDLSSCERSPFIPLSLLLKVVAQQRGQMASAPSEDLQLPSYSHASR
eukprot:m51a1_g1973 hypothetical protein (834) ;mRNA; f:1102551-1105656